LLETEKKKAKLARVIPGTEDPKARAIGERRPTVPTVPTVPTGLASRPTERNHEDLTPRNTTRKPTKDEEEDDKEEEHRSSSSHPPCISPENRTETVIPKAAAPVTKGPRRRKCQTQASTLTYPKEKLKSP
jgi:hypothetical protein